MDFGFSAEQELLRETVRRFLAERAPVSPYVRAQLDSPSGTTPEVWSGLAELGVLGLLVPGEHGGAGMGMVDVAVALEEMGRAVHPGPFASTAVGAVSLVALADGSAEAGAILRELAAGRCMAAVALDAGSFTAHRSGDGWVLRGAQARVADASAADLLVVVATTDDGFGAFVVDTDDDGLRVTPHPTVDLTRRFADIELHDADARRLAGDARAVADETRDRLTVAAVVDGLGAAEQALTLAVAYAKERRQFGRPIGSFQAVQHLCAEMLERVELGRAAAYYACWTCDAADPTERRRAATMAISFAGDAFYRVSASAIQVLGGIGFTWEHDAHLYYKRLLTLEQHDGPPHEHLERLAAIILD